MLPSGLSMLWEPVEPLEALRIRFGFEGLESAVDWLSGALLWGWRIALEDCSRLVISDRNAIVWVRTDRGPLVVKWSSARDRFAELEDRAALVTWLHGLGVPVAVPVAGIDGGFRMVQDAPHGPLSVGVLPEIDGDWLDIGDEAAVRAAGACLAGLHDALGSVSDDHGRGEPQDLRSTIRRWLAESDRGMALAASAELAEAVETLPPLVRPLQPLHNDFRAANLLTRRSEVVAVLDFDEVVRGQRVSDLAKASVYLGTRFTDWQPTPAAVRAEFRRGYESVRPLDPDEDRWLGPLIAWQSIMAVSMVPDPAPWLQAVTPAP